MITPAKDDRSAARKLLDEQIASEPPLPPPSLPAEAVPQPLEAHLKSIRKPVAVAGIVENGLVRPLDPTIHLPENSRVIIVATEAT
jgi:hypothetical protein